MYKNPWKDLLHFQKADLLRVVGAESLSVLPSGGCRWPRRPGRRWFLLVPRTREDSFPARCDSAGWPDNMRISVPMRTHACAHVRAHTHTHTHTHTHFVTGAIALT